MGKKKRPTKIRKVIYPRLREWLQADGVAVLDVEVAKARAQHVDGAQLRRRIDAFGLSYVRVAPWLGLTVEGLHKQMRGERTVSRQTVLLLRIVEMWVNDLAAFSAEELRHQATPNFRETMRRKYPEHRF